MMALVDASPNGAHITTSNGYTPLHVALENDVPEAVSLALITASPDAVYTKDGNGDTPLHIAFTKTLTNTVMMSLISASSSIVNRKARREYTPLHLALRNGVPEAVSLALIAASPDAVGVKDAFGYTPLHIALAKKVPEEVLMAIISASSEDAVNIKARNGYNPLYLALENDLPRAVSLALIAASPDAIKMKANNGSTPLQFALEKRVSPALVLALIQACPDAVKQRGKGGDIPLQTALEYGASEAVLLSLVAAWPDAIKEGGEQGWTLLHLALAKSVPKLFLKKSDTATTEMRRRCGDEQSVDLNNVEEVEDPEEDDNAMEYREGFMGMFRGMRKALKKRWCVLHEGTLMWFKGQQNFIKAGWLMKMSGGTSTFGRANWKRRWMALKGGELHYHEMAGDDAKVLGIVDIQGCEKIMNGAVDDLGIKRKFTFAIRTRDAAKKARKARTYFMSCESQEECDEWVETLDSVAGKTEEDIREKVNAVRVDPRNAQGTIEVDEIISVDSIERTDAEAHPVFIVITKTQIEKFSADDANNMNDWISVLKPAPNKQTKPLFGSTGKSPEWYAGSITNSAAKKRVMQAKLGAYLISDRSDGDGYALTVNTGEKAMAIQINRGEDNTYFLSKRDQFGCIWTRSNQR